MNRLSLSLWSCLQSLSCGMLAVVFLTTALYAEEPTSNVRGTLLAPKAFRAAAEKIKPAMVRIETFGGLSAAAAGAGGFRPGEGQTTGVIVEKEGYILTSTFNFLDKPPIITVILSTGERKIAQMLGRDETRRLCLLKIESDASLPAAQWVSRDALKVGQWTVALGFGFGEGEPALSAGIISATHRMGAKAVQTDANLSPANYGGPLIDIEGNLIGICAPLSPGNSNAAAGAEWYDSGIGFAVPLPPKEKVYQALREGKTLVAGFLGVQTKALADYQPGAQILKVIDKSGAAEAKLKEQDVIASVGGTMALDPTHLAALLQRYVAGDEIELGIVRGAEKLSVKATLGVAPPPEPKKKPNPKNFKKPPEKETPEKDSPQQDPSPDSAEPEDSQPE